MRENRLYGSAGGGALTRSPYPHRPFFEPRHCSAACVRVVLQAMCLAIPGKVTSISGEDPLMRTGKVDFGGVLKEVSLAYVPEVNVGDYVIVHVGFALSRVDEAEANQVFEYLREMQELSDLEDSGAGVSPVTPGVPPTVPAGR